MVVFSDLVSKYKVVFWDFDGVIKESLDAKCKAFLSIFENLNHYQRNYIASHHFSNGGVTRYKKIRHYLKYLNLPHDNDTVNYYIEKFSINVLDKVLSCDWVPGAYNFLNSNIYNQIFFLISATPDKELNTIVSKTNMTSFFTSYSGSSKIKSVFIIEMIKKYDLVPSSCIMIGDSLADLNAANDSGISFAFRRSKNSTVDYYSQEYPVFDHFLNKNQSLL